MTGKNVLSTRKLFAALLVSILLHLAVLFGWRASIEAPGVSAANKAMVISLKTRETATVLRREITSGKRVGAAGAHYLDTPVLKPGNLTKPARLIDSIDRSFSWPIGVLQEGRVTLRLVIGVDGHPIEVNVRKSNLPRSVEGEVVRRFYEARYAPGEIGSRPVASEIVVEVDLR